MNKHSKNILTNWKVWVGIGVIAFIITLSIISLILIKSKTEETTNKNITEENTIQNINDINIEDILNAIDEVNKDQGKKNEIKDINPKELIRITSVTTSEPNVAGGVDLDIKWTNMSDKIIKYITFTAYPVNAVGDIVECTIRTRNKGEFRGQQTGPINKGEGSKSGYVYENAWYNNTIIKATIMQIDIEYMDGTKVTLSPLQVDEVIY